MINRLLDNTSGFFRQKMLTIFANTLVNLLEKNKPHPYTQRCQTSDHQTYVKN